MPRNHEPSKVSQVLTARNGSRFAPSGRCRCTESVTGSHWWLIDPPRGPVSDGVCRYCGEHRLFANTLDASVGVGVK